MLSKFSSRFDFAVVTVPLMPTRLSRTGSSQPLILGWVKRESYPDVTDKLIGQFTEAV